MVNFKLRKTGEIDFKKNIIIFGVGDECKKFISQLKFIFYFLFHKEDFMIHISRFVDNDENKQGKNIGGIEVVAPDTLKDRKKNHLIVVTSYKYYFEILQQLEDYGYQENIDFIKAGYFIRKFLMSMNIDKIFDSILSIYKKRMEIESFFSHDTFLDVKLKKTVILFFGSGYGGVSPSLENTAKYLAGQGYRVEIYIDYSERCKELGIDLKERENIFIHYVNQDFFIFINRFILPIYRRAKEENIYYSFIVGFDPIGLFPAAFLSQALGIPFLYHSLEFYEEIGWEETIEKKLANKANFILTQDDIRAEKLSEILKLDRQRILLVYNSSIGSPIFQKENYFREKFSISSQKKIVLFAGSIIEEFCILEILKTVSEWPNEFVLIIHGWCFDKKLGKEIDKYIDFKRTFISREIFDSEKKYKVFQSADIGLVFYKPLNLNLICAAGASGKFYDFMRAGVPVVGNDILGMRDLVEKNSVGKVVSNLRELGSKLNDILCDYKMYREKCFEIFKKYEYSNQYSNVLSMVEDLSNNKV